MLTNKGKQLDGQFSPVYLEFPQRLEKNILNPGDNQQKKGKKKRGNYKFLLQRVKQLTFRQ